MHQYLRSIGFSKLTNEKDIDKLLKGYEKRGMSTAHRYMDAKEQMWLDIRMPVSEHMGLCIMGYIGARGSFHRVAYYPYLWSDDVTSNARPSVFRRVDGEVFSAIIDDARVGMTLIYLMDNPFDYLHKCGEGNPVSGTALSKLTAFCTKGFVLLPTIKANAPAAGKAANNGLQEANDKIGSDKKRSELSLSDSNNADGNETKSPELSVSDGDAEGSETKSSELSVSKDGHTKSSAEKAFLDARAALEKAIDDALNGKDNKAGAGSSKPVAQPPAPSNYNNSDQEARMSLLEAARNGQTDAIEQLAMEEMHTIATLSKRLQNEDIYSIVSSVFMPQGVECDIYLVVGDILKIDKIRNESTKEEIYDLTLNVNDMIIHVAINEADLEGEPAVGRRFKGRIWLQGRIEF